MAVNGQLRRRSVLSTDATNTTTRILDILHFHVPWIMVFLFLTAFITHSILTARPSEEFVELILTGPGGKPLPRSARKIREAQRKKKQLEDFSFGRKLLFQWLSAAVLATYLGNVLNIVAHALKERQRGWWCGDPTALYFCASMCFWSVIQISLIDSVPAPCITQQIIWVLTLLVELVLLGGSVYLFTTPHNEFNSIPSNLDGFRQGVTHWELIELVLDALRTMFLVFLVAFYIVFKLEQSFKSDRTDQTCGTVSGERLPLLADSKGNVASNGTISPTATGSSTEHGSAIQRDGNRHSTSPDSTGAGGDLKCKIQAEDDCDGDEVPAFYKATTVSDKTWWEYLTGYSLFFPYLWPSKSVRLQIVVTICFLLVILQRVVNIAVPIQLGVVTNKLYGKGNPSGGIPWLSISLLIGYKFLHGSSGILGALRTMLWIPVSQYSYNALTTASFEHVHSLSLDFHLGKRTGEVLSALSKGNSINNFLEQVTFQVLPMIFDLGVAIFYFAYAFDAYYALVVSVITFFYVYLTIRMARWRSEQRRLMQSLSREEDAVKNDSLTSYETVKYFGAEAYEFERYHGAVAAFQKAELKVNISLNILSTSQNLVFIAGLLIIAIIAAYQVTTGKREVGDFVTLITYMDQLQQPLNFFSSFYRSCQSAMISGERLLELFKEKPTVVDNCTARPMPSCEGQIRFQDVKFSYDSRKPALEGLNFTCPPGTTTAFVGESGGGKSTIFKLLYRFYNIEAGSIQIDGADIRDMTIDSLRTHVGVVPQDTVLFNETLMYNLRYANQDATDEQIYNACKAASIHDKIMTFPDRYNTKVGERGLRLSGGEKQRVAIARTILKDPRIIMLDEATAALDSDTEQRIQEALTSLSAGRTMLVIAHRLSTITNADQILVLHAGKVVEAGTHTQLLAQKGRYASMWKKQIRAERYAEAAIQAKVEANAWISRPGSSGPDASENEETIVGSTTPSLASKKLSRSAHAALDHCTSTPGTINYESSDDAKSDETNSTNGDFRRWDA